MKLYYTMLRPDLDVWHVIECDSYKFETHPVTGRYQLQLFQSRSAETKMICALSGVVMFRVERT